MRYFLLSLLLFFFMVTTVVAQFTSIPDTIFEGYLVQEGYDTDGLINGQMLTSEANVVPFLAMNSLGISDLTGIEDFVSLNILYVNSNNISYLDVSNSPNLTQVHCWQNQLDTLIFGTNNNLETIYCNDNQLLELDVTGLPQLKLLSISQNPISTINLNNNNLLQSYSCNFAPLNGVVIPSLHPNLVYLACIGTGVTMLDLSSNTALGTLHCGSNSLSSLDFSNNPNIARIQCPDNHLNSINLSNCTLLNHIYAVNNELTTLNLNDCSSLTQLFLSNNSIGQIDVSNNSLLNNFQIDDNYLSELDLSNNPLTIFFSRNNYLNYINLKNGSNNLINYLKVGGNLSSLTVCVDDSIYASTATNWQKDAATTYSDVCRNTSLLGFTRNDLNYNCLSETTETAVPYQFVKIDDGNQIRYARSNSYGKYTGELDAGTYNIELIPWGPYWNPCPTTQVANINPAIGIDTIDWSLQASAQCPHLSVSIGAPFLRATGGGSFYVVQYCNNGTTDALNAYIEVDIDQQLNILGASIPINNQNNQLLTFNLGTVPVGACDHFLIYVIVDPNSVNTQIHCTQAHIYPDSICLPIWGGPRVEAAVDCQNDTVFFKLKNVGTNMLLAHNYAIFEDDLIIRMDTFNLGGGDSITISQYAIQGKTYRIEANQAIGYPAILGGSIAHATVEGCHTFSNNSHNTGFAAQYYTGNSSPFIAVDCQPNISSYDPNDKAAQPQGYGVQHYINKNIPLEYRVRFQNTGTDTAFNIVIIDTLSPFLNPTSLQMGASSHSYTWNLSGTGILTVTFAHILLVDSNANEALSHGFFSYNIQQQPNLNSGTVINNQAAIYFDYNSPIFTNTTFHTIEEDFVPIVLEIKTISSQQQNILVYPNPTTSRVYIEQAKAAVIQVQVSDHLGRILIHKEVDSRQESINLKNYPSGIYYLTINNGQQLSSHKIIKN